MRNRIADNMFGPETTNPMAPARANACSKNTFRGSLSSGFRLLFSQTTLDWVNLNMQLASEFQRDTLAIQTFFARRTNNLFLIKQQNHGNAPQHDCQPWKANHACPAMTNFAWSNSMSATIGIRKQIFLIFTLATRRDTKLQLYIVFALNLVLVLRQKAQISDIV